MGRTKRARGKTLPATEFPMAGIRFKNFGRSPAIIQEVGTGLEYSENVPEPVYDVKVVMNDIITAGEESDEFGTIIAGQYTMAQALKVREGSGTIWIYGYVAYDDIFGASQIHRFFQRLVRVGQFRYVCQSYDYKHYNRST
jgi:hypothetical protein